MINRTLFCGNLTHDAELRSTSTGTYVLQMTVAVNDRRKNSRGEWEDYPNFVDCAMFGERAGKIADLLTKGTKVFVDGELRYNQWEKDGVKRSKLNVVVDDIDFVTKSNRSEERSGVVTYQSPKAAEFESDSLYDEDLPF